MSNRTFNAVYILYSHCFTTIIYIEEYLHRNADLSLCLLQRISSGKWWRVETGRASASEAIPKGRKFGRSRRCDPALCRWCKKYNEIYIQGLNKILRFTAYHCLKKHLSILTYYFISLLWNNDTNYILVLKFALKIMVWVVNNIFLWKK